jgi:hypothetical protein
MRWVENVACMGQIRNSSRVLVEKPEERSVGRLRRRIILKWMFEKWGRWAWTGSIWLSTGTGGGLL